MFRRIFLPLLNPALLGYAATVFAVAAADVGCQKSASQATLKGQVTYRGQPVSLGAVTFFPEGGRPVTAPISEQGNYQVELPRGDYAVIVNQGFSPPARFQGGRRPTAA